MIRTNCFSATPCSFDLQTTVLCYNFNLDKELIHAVIRTGIYNRDLIHKSLYTLLLFSSRQRNKFIFCSTTVNIVFSFINISTPTSGMRVSVYGPLQALSLYIYIYIYILCFDNCLETVCSLHDNEYLHIWITKGQILLLLLHHYVLLDNC